MALRDTTRAALVGLFGIIAIAVAARSLDSTTVFGDLGTGSGPGGAGGGGPPLPTPSGPSDAVPLLPDIVAQVLLAGLLIAGAVLGASYALRYWRTVLVMLAASAAALGVAALFQADGELSAGLPLPFQPAGPPGTESGSATMPFSIPEVVVAVVLMGVVGLAILMLRPDRRSKDRDAEPDRIGEDREAVAAIGRAAGRAADRIDDAPGPTNDVYRAWQEMTALLDVADPETTTPGQFADAAITAGLGRADVRDLTLLFEDVRYGADTPTPADEARAVAVLRRIEERYAEVDA